MKILLTGANGFLGWHTRVRLGALTEHEVIPVDRATWSRLPELAKGVDAVIHVAGINRATAQQVKEGNIALARDLVSAVDASDGRATLVYANSIQSGNNSPYGVGKGIASEMLAAAAQKRGSVYVDVRLPNLFGEHGRPRYNSFVQTFVHCVIDGETPNIEDRPVDLLHVQAAAQSLIEGIGATSTTRLHPAGTTTSVRTVFETLHLYNHLYATGDIPPLLSDFDLDLFNTLRAARFPTHYPIGLTSRKDSRGSLVEVVRAHGGQGQTFVSTTKPGMTRGEHFHLRKVERFVVLSGRACISLRRLFTDAVVTFDVSGAATQIVDMPTMWVHNITNTGDTELTTLFWTHELFDPDRPDTYAEPVECVVNGADRC